MARNNYRNALRHMWYMMIKRCHDPTAMAWKHYGARGVSVCNRWRNSFEAFVEDMGPRPPRMQVERKDNDGNYCKDNCKWATTKEQSRNKRSNRLITWNGETLPMVVWAERLGFNRCIISDRLKRGWTVADALSYPCQTILLARGEHHHGTKLTAVQVAEMRLQRHKSQGELAEQYGVSKSVIGNILNGRSWRPL